MRSSPQVGLSCAISTINFWSSAGTRGRPRGFDFHLQNSRKPLRCHRMKVSGLTKVRASRHANRPESNTRVNRVASLARRGLTWRSKYKANCLRRKRFSAASAFRERSVRRMNLRPSGSKSWTVWNRRRTERRVCIHFRFADTASGCHRLTEIGRYGIIAEVVRAHFCGGRCSCSSLMFVRLRVAICAEQRDDRKTRRQQSSFRLISSSRRVSSAIAADFTSAPHRILDFSLSFRHNGSRLAKIRDITQECEKKFLAAFPSSRVSGSVRHFRR
jgi:hypothetical protein